MNIERTSNPRGIYSSSPSTAKAASQSTAGDEPTDSVTFSTAETTIQLLKPRERGWTEKAAHHASKVIFGAGEGLALGLMSNGMGPVGATLTNGAINGVVSGVEGYKFGKKIGREVDNPEVQSKLTRHFATSGAINGTVDGLFKGAIVAGLTAVTGGNLAVGAAAGGALNYLD